MHFSWTYAKANRLFIKKKESNKWSRPNKNISTNATCDATFLLTSCSLFANVIQKNTKKLFVKFVFKQCCSSEQKHGKIIKYISIIRLRMADEMSKYYTK